MKNHLMQFFEYSHLPEHLQAVSKPFGELAAQIDLPCRATQRRRLRCGSCSKQRLRGSFSVIQGCGLRRQESRALPARLTSCVWKWQTTLFNRECERTYPCRLLYK